MVGPSEWLKDAEDDLTSNGLLRYPDARPPAWTPPDQVEAEEAARWAEEIVRDVRARLP